MTHTPDPFAALVSQPLATNLLTSSLKRDQIAATYLFEGVAGIGKATAARLFAAQLLECDLHNLDYHPDCISLSAEIGNVIRVQQIRDLVTQVSTYPLQALRRVVIVEGAQGMNTAAGNAFLKTLEESRLTTFILLCDQPLRLATIRSRGQTIPFYPLAPADLKTVLIQVAPALLDYPELLLSAEGSPGAALTNGKQAAACAAVKEGLQSLTTNVEDLFDLSQRVSQLPDETQQWLLRFIAWSGWQHPGFLSALDQAQQQLRQHCYALSVWERLLEQLAHTPLTLRLEAPHFEDVNVDSDDEGETEAVIDPITAPSPQPTPVPKGQMSLFGYQPG